MEVRDIKEKKFGKGLNGYKMEEVDDFLEEMAAEFVNLKKLNEEQEKKMEVLADKIREYRNDEDSIKEAILGAQKQSTSVLAAAKEKSETMISEAKEKSEKMIKDAEDRVKEKDEYAKKLVDDANAEKTKIVAECERKSAEIKAEMEAEIKKQESILAKTRDESKAFIERLLTSYKEHIEYINSIPEKCDNQFVLDAKDTIKFTEEKKSAEAAPRLGPAPAAAVKAADEVKPAKAEEKKPELKLEKIKKENREVVLDKTSEIASKPVFEEESVTEDVEEYEETPAPLFDKSKRKSKYEKLQFGNNNKK